MHKLYCLIIGFILINPSIVYSQCQVPSTDFSSCNYTPIGHRGYSSVYPENTLLALEELFKRGVKYTEVDVSLTSDNVYVLFHDAPSIYRTSNGTGNIREKTLAELKQLDYGSWKGEQFKGLKIPTLIEALQLAEKYNAYLYLDTKNYNLQSLKSTLEESGVAPNRMMPSLTTLAQAALFRSLLPNTPWVWFGGGDYPSDINDDFFYNHSVELGCYAFEVSSSNVGDSLWNTFKTKVKNAGGKIWAFTENDNSRIQELINLGVDGIESDRAWESGLLACNNITGNPYDNLTTGNWIFNGNLNAINVGSQLRLLKTTNVPVNEQVEFASCNILGVPFIEGQNKIVAKIPAYNASNGIMVYNNSRDENFGILDNTYTLVMDILLPQASAGKWISLLQTNTINANDGDFFINPAGGIGIGNSYHGIITPNVWNRIAIVYDGPNNLIKKYINGVYVGENMLTTGTTRWAIWNSSRSGDDQGFLIFADDDGETAELYISALQLRNYVTDSISIVNLGGVKSTGIKINNADCWNAKLDIAYNDSTLLDYERKTYYFVVPSNLVLDSAFLTFSLFDNARTTITSPKKINITQPLTWQVISEDSSNIITWKACVRKEYLGSGKNEESITEAKVTVYPNPASTEIHIKNLKKLNSSYQIVDILGKIVQHGTLNLHEDVVNTSTIKQGIYFLIVKQGVLTQPIKLYINN
jgi:glycerophosphoryl diester phosphodiesterase